ncbi:MAG: hypothetical protein WCC10_10700 [Tumebacillaceae bacterium]
MKNERIITHFLSYTSAQGCVKDLIPYFSGRISIASPAAANQAARNTDEPPSDNPLDDVMQVGGIALGTLAYLIPGMSPMITGGPAAGSAIGQTVGFYMESQMADSDKWDEAVDQDEEKQRGPFFVWLDVRSDDEAQVVERIFRQHGGIPEHIPSEDVPGTQDEPDYTYDPPGDDIPDGSPQLAGQAQRRIPHEDGYDLDPIPPVSPQNFVDPNIGYGSYDLIDPAGVFKDDAKTD